MKDINGIQELEAILNGTKPALIDFYADWCGPCRSQLPIVDELSDTHKEDFEVVKINVDRNRELAQQYGVRSIPALFFVKDGEVKEQLLGLQSKHVLDTKIRQYIQEAA